MATTVDETGYIVDDGTSNSSTPDPYSLYYGTTDTTTPVNSSSSSAGASSTYATGITPPAGVYPDPNSPTGYSDKDGNPVTYDSSSNKFTGSDGASLGTGSNTQMSNAGSTINGLIKKFFTNSDGTLNLPAIGGVIGGGLGAIGALKPNVSKVGYQGGIPQLVANRNMMTAPPATVNGKPYRPGQGGVNWGGDVMYTQKAAHGGLMGLAHGGSAGHYLQGDTDGMADKLHTSIDGKQPAALSHGEFVVPADVVSHLGNGNSDAGAKKLYQMMDKIREARTGTTKQGRQINPDKFMPGGLAKLAHGGVVRHFDTGGTTGTTTPAGTTGVEQTPASWAGQYTADMLAKGEALANAPYQQYQGPLTAGASDLQNQAFSTASNLQTPAAIGQAANTAGDIATKAQNLSYTPQTTDFNAQSAMQYMNPYLQASLNPQLAEARRQADITAQQNAAQMTQAGAFGGGRQAILQSENQRNLGTNLANITGQGYNTAYNNAEAQFNADQNRKSQEAQFGATYANQGLQTGLQAAQAQGQLGAQQNQTGLANLTEQANLGTTQRGITSEGIAADQAAFNAARDNPYKMVQYEQSLLNGLPISATNYTQAQPSTAQQILSGAGGIAGLFGNKTSLTMDDVTTALNKLGLTG